MARRRSSFSSSKPSQQRNTQTQSRPQPQSQAQTQPTQQRGGLLSGFMGTIVQGMAFGAGSEVAHNVVGGMMGKGQHQQEQQQTNQNSQNCQLESDNFMNCLKINQDDIQQCQDYLKMLTFCQKN